MRAARGSLRKFPGTRRLRSPRTSFWSFAIDTARRALRFWRGRVAAGAACTAAFAICSARPTTGPPGGRSAFGRALWTATSRLAARSIWRRLISPIPTASLRGASIPPPHGECAPPISWMRVCAARLCWLLTRSYPRRPPRLISGCSRVRAPIWRLRLP